MKSLKAGAFFALAFFIFTITACQSPGNLFPHHTGMEEKEQVLDEEANGAAEQKNADPGMTAGEDGAFARVREIDIPQYTGNTAFVLNDNVPFFSEEEKEAARNRLPEDSESGSPAEQLSELDALGRCGPALALVSLDTLPQEERGLIGNVRPSGWHTVKYEGIDGNYLFNRCHLIAYCLTGNNADERNLITGTRYLNVEGMLPFELQVLDHVVKNRDHVLYRSTPIFTEEELVARGVLLEAWSVEDNGLSLSLCVFCYNIQPGITIDYSTGESTQQ